VLIVLDLNKGTLTIESEADDLPIRIIQGDEVVKRLTVTKGAETVRIAAGPYVVEIDGKFSGFKVDGETVSLSRGGTETVKIVRSAETPASDKGNYNQQRARGPYFVPPSPASDLSPAAQALEKLQTEFSEIEVAYHKAIEKTANDADDVEFKRVRAEMNPREIMPAKYLAFEEKHRGTNYSFWALTKVAQMAGGNFDPTSNAFKGRVEAADRLIKHYLHHPGLEAIARVFTRGPLASDEFLQALVEKSPHRKTQAEALILQVIQGRQILTLESQWPTVIAQLQPDIDDPTTPPGEKTELQRLRKEFENIDFKQLRADLNDKLKRLADTYSDVEVEIYGTGGAAAQRLAHAINKVIVGGEAPEITATDINGQVFQLSKLRGNIVVLLFAETFVSDDNKYKELYAPLRGLVAKFKSRPVQFVGIMSSDDQANLRAATKRGDFNWTVLPQPPNGPLQLDWGIEANAISVYIVDDEGILQPQLSLPYYGDGGYDIRELEDKLAELPRPKYAKLRPNTSGSPQPRKGKKE
jgi:peroxiredoxin